MKYPPNADPVSGVVMNETVTAPLDSTDMQRRDGGDNWAMVERGNKRNNPTAKVHDMRLFPETGTDACIAESVWPNEMKRNGVGVIVAYKFTSIKSQPKKKKGVL